MLESNGKADTGVEQQIVIGELAHATLEVPGVKARGAGKPFETPAS
jgi:hypothetical protein